MGFAAIDSLLPKDHGHQKWSRSMRSFGVRGPHKDLITMQLLNGCADFNGVSLLSYDGYEKSHYLWFHSVDLTVDL